MLAEYNLHFPSFISSLDDEQDLLGTSDELLQLDVSLVQVISDDDDMMDMMDGLCPATNLNLLLMEDADDPPCQSADGGCSLQGVARGKVEGSFGSPGSDYFTNAYLTALRDSEGIDDSEALLASGLLQSDADMKHGVELSDSDDSLAWSTLTAVNSSCPSSPAAKRKKLCDLQWSEMDRGEQGRALDVITNAIRDCDGIREQLELLRIIGQDMTVLPTDSRFQIDAANMNDTKLKSIHDYLSQMARHTSEPSAKEPHHSESVPRHKKTLERRAQHKAHRKRRTKEKKQCVKERRSGLFDREVVLSLQIQDDNDREINILD